MLYNSPVSSRAFRGLVFSILLVVPCFHSIAQSAGKTKLSYKLLSIHVKGLNRFKDDEIIASSGLKLGQIAGETEFKQAAQILGETGLFTNLTYSYQYSPAGCNLELQVEENDNLIPIIFDNFVWFSDEALIGLLHTRLPLFDGRLPMGGNLADQVSTALKSIMAERRISGEAEYLPFAHQNGPVEFYQYKVSFHPIVVRNVAFPGASPAEVPALQAAAKSVVGQDYLRTNMRAQERLSLLPVYHSRGYLKAQFADSQAKVADDGAQTLVEVSFPVTPGLQYKLSGVQWTGNAILPDDQLQALIHLKLGEPANAVQLGNDLEQVQKLYGSKGYLLAQVSPAPAMDDAQSTVSYQFNVTEGDLYRMGKLEIEGIDSANAQKIVTQWQLKAGDPFDNGYMDRFFNATYRDIGLRGSWNVVHKQSINQQDKTVSVALHFMPKS